MYYRIILISFFSFCIFHTKAQITASMSSLTTRQILDTNCQLYSEDTSTPSGGVVIVELPLRIEQTKNNQARKEANQREVIKKREERVKREYDYSRTEQYNYREFTGKKRRLFKKLNRQKVILAKMQVSLSNIRDVDGIPIRVKFRKKSAKDPVSDKEVMVWTIIGVDCLNSFERTGEDEISVSFWVGINDEEPFSSSAHVFVNVRKGDGKSAGIKWILSIKTDPQSPEKVNFEYSPTEDQQVLEPLNQKALFKKNIFYSTNLIEIRADFLEEVDTLLNTTNEK